MADQPRTKKKDPLAEVVKLLDKTTRVMQAMSMRIDVLAFGQDQCERRLGKLERADVRRKAASVRAHRTKDAR
jgi:hypothetical protein